MNRQLSLPLAAAATVVLFLFLPQAAAAFPALSGLLRSPWPWLSLALFAAGAGLHTSHQKVALAAIIASLLAARGASSQPAIDKTVPSAQRLEGIVRGPVARSATSIRMTIATARGAVEVIVADRDAEADVLPGDRVSVWARAAADFDFRSPGAAPSEPGLLIASVGDLEILERRAEATLWRRAASTQRAVSAIIAARGGSERGKAIVRALAAGDRSAISRDLATTLRCAGLAHLLAVSGLHLAAVSVLLFVIVRRLWPFLGPISRAAEAQTAAAIVALIGAAVYTAVTGARPSTLRALLVATFAFAGLATFRRPSALPSLGAAALVLLVADPSLVADASFQMSFAAATALAAAFAHRPERRAGLARLVLIVAQLAFVSTLALLATAPISVPIYGEFPLAAVPLNVLVVPLVEVVLLPLALLGVLLSAAAPWLGFVLDAAIAIAELVARLAEFSVAVAPPLEVAPLRARELILLGALVLSLIVLARRRGRGQPLARVAIIAIGAAAALSVSVGIGRCRTPSAALKVTFLDVGQGDAAVLEFPSGEVWLVDAGGNPMATSRDGGDAPGRRSVAPFLRSRRIDRLDVVVVSHAHPDHFRGLWAVAESVEIGQVIATPRAAAETPELASLLRWLQSRGARVASPPARIDVGAATVRFLAPHYMGEIAADPVSSENDNSVALRVDFAGRSLLFAGDLESEGEELVGERAAALLDVDVVKVNHHGSRTSSTPGFVAATSPALAVISCGRANRFGFPHEEVVRRWRAAGAEVLRTDEGGAIFVSIAANGEISTASLVALPRRGRE